MKIGINPRFKSIKYFIISGCLMALVALLYAYIGGFTYISGVLTVFVCAQIADIMSTYENMRLY